MLSIDTTEPHQVPRCAFQNVRHLSCYSASSSLITHHSPLTTHSSPVVALRIELSATVLSEPSGPPVLSYRGKPETGGRNEAQFLPLRSSRLESHLSSPCGSRTHLTALKEWHPQPIDERAVALNHHQGTKTRRGTPRGTTNR